MKLVTKFMTNNDCYKQGRKIKPQGIMVHSTATPGVMAERWFDLWNKPGINKCVHAFVDDKGVYQYLPWDMRGWHAGGSANNTHIGFEICEPKNLDDKEYFQKVWRNSVELTAMLCKDFNIPLDEVIGHYEGYKKGIASNHADPGHWFPRHGKSMDDFRADVKKLLAQDATEPTQTSVYFVQAGAFQSLLNAEKYCQQLKSKGFDAIIKESGGIYRVQVGAYSVKSNADSMVAKLKKAGFDAFITTEGGRVIIPSSLAPRSEPTTEPAKTLKVGSKVKVKPGAKTYDGKKLADFVYKEIYDVIQVNGDRVVIGKGKAVTAAVHKKDLILQSITPAKPTPKPVIKVGSKVKVKQGAKTYTGGNLASFVYNNVYEVIQINGDRVVIGKGKTVTAVVKVQDLILLL